MGTTDISSTANVKAKLGSTRKSRSGLKGSVGIGGANAPDDVYRVSSALHVNGLMDAPQREADNMLYKSIIGAQERMDSTLKRDGLINPGGPTQQTFDKLAGQGFVKPVDISAQAGIQPSIALNTGISDPRPATGIYNPRPATGDAALNAQMTAVARAADVEAARDKAMQTAGDVTRTGFQQMQDVQRVRKAKAASEAANARARHEEIARRQREQHDRLQAMQKNRAEAERQASKVRQESVQAIRALGNKAGQALQAFLAPSLRPLGQGPEPLTDEAIASNQRLSDALKRRHGVGELPRFTQDAIHEYGEKAVNEVADLIEQVRANDPAQADELHVRTRDGLSGDQQTALDMAVAGMSQSRDAKKPFVDPGQGDPEKTDDTPPDPGQDDDPDEPGETPDDPGQDDPEDPCARYEQAVAEAEAEVAELEARADELEREIVELANQVMALEREKQQILERLQGMTVVYIGAKLHPDPVVDGTNKIIGMSDEEFYREREKLLIQLKALNKDVDELRNRMHSKRKQRQGMNSVIARARGQLAQAKADLHRCEQG